MSKRKIAAGIQRWDEAGLLGRACLAISGSILCAFIYVLAFAWWLIKGLPKGIKLKKWMWG